MCFCYKSVVVNYLNRHRLCLGLSYAKSGGKAVITKNANGKNAGSRTARKELIKLIDSKKTVNIKYTDGPTMVDNNGIKSSNDILFNPKEIQASIDNVSKDLNSSTWGWAMTFFHEIGHTLYKGGKLEDSKGIDDPGMEALPNKIRRELGVKEYGQALLHSPLNAPDGKQYFPFSMESYNKLINNKMPIDKYILAGW